MLEGRYAELCGEIEDGAFTGAVLLEAIKERRLIYEEIIRCRIGEIDDEERETAFDEWPGDDEACCQYCGEPADEQ